MAISFFNQTSAVSNSEFHSARGFQERISGRSLNIQTPTLLVLVICFFKDVPFLSDVWSVPKLSSLLRMRRQ